MSQARRKKTNLNHRLIIAGLREILFIFFCFAGLYLFVSLFTYYPLDLGLSDNGNEASEVVNKGGLVGAFFADVFFKLFGYFAYLFAFMTAYVGWIIYQGKHHDILAEPKHLIVPGIGFLLTLSAGCGLAIVHFAAESALLPSHAGGLLGHLVGETLQNVFSQLGATLLLLALFFTGVTLLTGLSWLKLMDFLGEHTLRMTPVVRRYLSCRILPLLWRGLRKLGYWLGLGVRGAYSYSSALVGGQWRNLRDYRSQRRQRKAAATNAAEYAEAESQAEIADERYFEPSLASGPDSWNDAEAYDAALRAAEDSAAQTRAECEAGFESLADDTPHPLASDVPLPGIGLLVPAPPPESARPDLKPLFLRVQMALQGLSVDAKVKGVYPGPILSRVEIKPGKQQFSEVAKISEQLVARLGIPGVHVRETTPGMLSLEIPNAQPKPIVLSELLLSPNYGDNPSPLSVALGKDVLGHPVVIDLARLPHLLIAGSNSLDISRALHSIVVSMLYKATPAAVRFIMVDSAHRALQVYHDLPHLLTPVLRQNQEIHSAFHWCVSEMERRYRLMADVGARNINGYNRTVTDPEQQRTEEGISVQAQALPYLVLVVHELAELLEDPRGGEVEDHITRLAQKARAAGIHMVIASQQPTVHVITGLMKTNFPSRICFQVSGKNESRTVLGQHGAESLLGNGDMFYLTPATAVPARIHGVQLSLDEVARVVDALKTHAAPAYLDLAREYP